jgi:hypothetical protein
VETDWSAENVGERCSSKHEHLCTQEPRTFSLPISPTPLLKQQLKTVIVRKVIDVTMSTLTVCSIPGHFRHLGSRSPNLGRRMMERFDHKTQVLGCDLATSLGLFKSGSGRQSKPNNGAEASSVGTERLRAGSRSATMPASPARWSPLILLQTREHRLPSHEVCVWPAACNRSLRQAKLAAKC